MKLSFTGWVSPLERRMDEVCIVQLLQTGYNGVRCDEEGGIIWKPGFYFGGRIKNEYTGDVTDMDDGRTELFERIPVPRAVMQLAVPTILGSLVTVIYNMADTYFVGMLGNPVQNAAVTLAAPVLLAFNAVNNLFGVGCGSMMSRGLGRKDYEGVRKCSAFGFYGALGSGILFSVLCIVFLHPLLLLLGADSNTMEATLGYLKWTVLWGAAPAILNVVMAYMVRSEGSSLHASVGTMSGCLLNMILDPIFILPWGLDMEAGGAGLATFLSNCVACVYFFVLLYVKRGHTYVCIHPKKFTLSKVILTGVCAVGIPAAIQNFLNVTGMTILNNFTSAYGPQAVAAMGIAQKINMVPIQVALGFTQGIMSLISYTYASGNHRRMKKTVFFAAKTLLPLLAAMSLLYYIGAGPLIRSFMNNDAIVASGARFLRGFCLGIPFLCMDFLAVGIFQALGKGRSALCFAILRKILLEIPCLYVLNLLFPLYGLAYAQLIAEVILAAAAVIMLRHMFGKMDREARMVHHNP